MTNDYCYYKFYILLMFNFQIFLLLSICDNIKETQSVDNETLCYTISLSLGPVSSTVGKLIIHLLLDHLALNIFVLLIHSS